MKYSFDIIKTGTEHLEVALVSNVGAVSSPSGNYEFLMMEGLQGGGLFYE